VAFCVKLPAGNTGWSGIVVRKSELLFPHQSIAALEGLRSQEWDLLVRRVAALPEMNVDSLAFSLMMVRLCGCTGCNMGSYKASLGCTTCAQRTVSGEGDLEDQLDDLFAAAKAEILAYLENGRKETPSR
jgi:hypothetical protein